MKWGVIVCWQTLVVKVFEGWNWWNLTSTVISYNGPDLNRFSADPVTDGRTIPWSMGLQRVRSCWAITPVGAGRPFESPFESWETFTSHTFPVGLTPSTPLWGVVSDSLTGGNTNTGQLFVRTSNCQNMSCSSNSGLWNWAPENSWEIKWYKVTWALNHKLYSLHDNIEKRCSGWRSECS